MSVSITADRLEEYSDRARGAVVVITGGATGLGKATALLFARHGAKVVIGDVNEGLVKETQKEVEALGSECLVQRCDVTSWEDQTALFEKTFERFGSIDIAVANAGRGSSGLVIGQADVGGRIQKPTSILNVLDVNLNGVLYTAHLALHYMQQTPATGAPKSLILMSSMYGLMPAYGVLADYSMSKHAVLSLSRSLAARYKKAGIKVASVHPWFSDTVMVPDTLRRLLHGMPYTPITSVAGAVLHAATDPDVDRTAGCTYTLPDDGPVVREDYYTGSGLLAELFARMDALVPPSAPGPTAAGSAAA